MSGNQNVDGKLGECINSEQKENIHFYAAYLNMQLYACRVIQQKVTFWVVMFQHKSHDQCNIFFPIWSSVFYSSQILFPSQAGNAFYSLIIPF